MAHKLSHQEVQRRHAVYVQLGTFSKASKALNVGAACLCSQFRQHGLPSRPRNGSFDLVGQRFEKLVVIGLAKENRNGKRWWNCRCDCGKTIIQHSGCLRDGRARSCGCLNWEGRLKPGNESAFNRVYCNYTIGSKKRGGHTFSLTKDEFRTLTSKACQYCGHIPSRKSSPIRRVVKREGSDFFYNGIDRVDNSKGYESGNMVPCCTTCNLAKRGMSVDEFKSWIKRVYVHVYGVLP